MKAKDKAIELVNGFVGETQDYQKAKQCALIAVNEIFQLDYYTMQQEPFDELMEFWNEVKQEIEKL